MRIVVLVVFVFCFIGYGFAFSNPAYEYATPKVQRAALQAGHMNKKEVKSSTILEDGMLIDAVEVEVVGAEFRNIGPNKNTVIAYAAKKRTAYSPASLRSGKAVYAACAGCHGQQAEKSALHSSQIIRGWNYVRISNILNEYKTQTYGGSMKEVMKQPALKLSDEEILAVSKYISSL